MMDPAQLMGAAQPQGGGAGAKGPPGGPGAGPEPGGVPGAAPGADGGSPTPREEGGAARPGAGVDGAERRPEADGGREGANGIPDELRIPEEKDDGDSQHIGHEDFLELMMAQLENQDPMDPTSTDEFMGQIAQFTTASGIDQLQREFSEFFEHMRSDQSLRASALVGREVVTEGREGVLPDEGSLEAILQLDASVPNLTVTVENQAGERVHREHLGEQPEGEQVFQWDGTDEDGNRLPAGTYQVSAYVEEGDDRRDVPTLVGAPVTSVTLGKDGQPPQLNVAGMGEVSLSDVRRVR